MATNQEYISVAEYGQWLYGYLPTGDITAIIHFRNSFIDSYIDKHVPHDETSLGDALEAYINDDELRIPEGSYWNPEKGTEIEHDEGELVSALVGIPVQLKDFKTDFREQIIKGNIHLDTPAIMNRFGDIRVHEDHTEQTRNMFLLYARERHKDRR